MTIPSSSRPLSFLKNMFVPSAISPRTILHGPLRRITLDLSLKTQMQTYLGLFEKEVHFWLEALTSNIATGIDVGAAHGEYTLFLLLKTSAEFIYAFEPHTDFHAVIRRNLHLNALDGSSRLRLSSQLVGASASGDVVSLDSLAPQISFPCFIKVDVDGGEEEILKGAEHFNRQKGIRWLIETHSRDLEAACEARLKRANFKTAIIPNAWWRVFLPELRPCEQNRWLAAWNDDAI